jgi:hypothetical protein
MFLDVNDRGTGKTTSLIMDAYYTGFPIVTTSITRRNNIQYQANQMGMSCVKVMTIHDLENLKGHDNPEQVLIDELEDVLTALLGCRVVKANMSRKGVI